MFPRILSIFTWFSSVKILKQQEQLLNLNISSTLFARNRNCPFEITANLYSKGIDLLFAWRWSPVSWPRRVEGP